jgi:hypothetical protein
MCPVVSVALLVAPCPLASSLFAPLPPSPVFQLRLPVILRLAQPPTPLSSPPRSSLEPTPTRPSHYCLFAALELLLQSVCHKSTIEPQRGPCCMCTLSGTRSWNAASISVLMAATTACSATGSRSGTSNMSSSCT